MSVENAVGLVGSAEHRITLRISGESLPRIIIGAPDKPDKITSSCENIFSKESIVLTHIVGEQPY